MLLSLFSMADVPEQFQSFVLTLAHVHANASKRCQTSEDVGSHLDAKQTESGSEQMLERIVRQEKLSVSYRDMVDNHIMHI